MSWLLVRIDDRLIHGQVLVAWGQRLRPARIWVADDAAAADEWERDTLAMSAPGIDVRVVAVEEMARRFAEEAMSPGGAFLLVRTLAAAGALIEAGAPLTAITIGGLHYAPGRTKLNEYVYLDDQDRTTARALLARGVQLLAQDVPAAKPQPLATLEPALGSH